MSTPPPPVDDAAVVIAVSTDDRDDVHAADGELIGARARAPTGPPISRTNRMIMAIYAFCLFAVTVVVIVTVRHGGSSAAAGGGAGGAGAGGDADGAGSSIVFPTAPGAPVPRPLLLGHRGVPAEAPENTAMSFARAMAEGADGYELDVMQTADGLDAVIHDDALERTTNGTGFVHSSTRAYLDTVSAAARFAPGWSTAHAAGFSALSSRSMDRFLCIYKGVFFRGGGGGGGGGDSGLVFFFFFFFFFFCFFMFLFVSHSFFFSNINLYSDPPLPFSGAAFAKVPTLTEALTAGGASALVDVEIKVHGFETPSLAAFSAHVADTIVAAAAERRVVVSSFDLAAIAAVRARAPEIRTGLIVSAWEGTGKGREALGLDTCVCRLGVLFFFFFCTKFLILHLYPQPTGST
jgi:glycerophosphoryl diester phosphodiesterase